MTKTSRPVNFMAPLRCGNILLHRKTENGFNGYLNFPNRSNSFLPVRRRCGHSRPEKKPQILYFSRGFRSGGSFKIKCLLGIRNPTVFLSILFHFHFVYMYAYINYSFYPRDRRSSKFILEERIFVEMTFFRK